VARRSNGSPQQASQQSAGNGSQLDKSLGWFSLGLGLAEVLAPRTVGRMIGVGEHTTILRLCGMREIASGLGLLSGRAPAAFATSRVVGDAMDLALLGASLRSPDCNPSRIAVAATAVAGVAAVDLYASKRDVSTALAAATQETAPVTVALAMNRPAQEIYEFWRKLENLPRFMRHVESVRETGERTSRWVAKIPGGTSVEWDSEILEDRPGEYISWRTLGDSEVKHTGNVRFEAARGGSGTIVRVEMQYDAAGGNLAARVASVFSAAPETMVKEDLRRLKQLLEAGEIATTRGQPAGTRSVIGRVLGRASSKESS
jgi:uncharacterized membrane protein